jgi:hypothetical protein
MASVIALREFQILPILTCFSEAFRGFFDDETLLASLFDDALHNIIQKRLRRLLYYSRGCQPPMSRRSPLGVEYEAG